VARKQAVNFCTAPLTWSAWESLSHDWMYPSRRWPSGHGDVPAGLVGPIAEPGAAQCDLSSSSRYYAIRGRVVGITTEGGAEHVETLAQRYLGTPYPWYGGRDQVRAVLTIRADKIRAMG
jgi:hypothetical protein